MSAPGASARAAFGNFLVGDPVGTKAVRTVACGISASEFDAVKGPCPKVSVG